MGKTLKKIQFIGKKSYIRGVRVGDYDSAVRFEKFKMADPIRQAKQKKKNLGNGLPLRVRIWQHLI